MRSTFAQTISELRRERRISQRKAAADLGISQALLSHYENGVREPRLTFICTLARYYGVSADFILVGDGRAAFPEAELARGSINHAIDYASEIGGGETGAAAARYLYLAANNVISLLENPNRPYEPQVQVDIRTAENELVNAVRKNKEQT